MLTKVNNPICNDIIRIDMNSQCYRGQIQYTDPKNQQKSRDVILKTAFNQKFNDQMDMILMFVPELNAYSTINLQQCIKVVSKYDSEHLVFSNLKSTKPTQLW
ncbi:Hypothetical_protein [Hexamita inflata]|uniref:Hypothetical_protein n=1 Tax=Hexamita inflata TaxID=28002 RepID=A0AA86TTE8_9EUKA|nr:Hypothetical protein HINF_LOCUS13847 [Hexamita inflata]